MSRKTIPKASANRNRDLLSQWRLLRSIGIYDTKNAPKLADLTPSRKKTIDTKFKRLQSLGHYEQGEVYRPAHRHEVTKKGRTTVKYEIDTDHFQVLNKKPAKGTPRGTLKTSKGFITPKAANEKVIVNKKGQVESIIREGAALTRFTRTPLSGPTEFLTLIADVQEGRLTFKNNEGLALYNNGKRTIYYGQSAVSRMIGRLHTYAQGAIFHDRRRGGGRGKFDDWASNSEISYVKRR